MSSEWEGATLFLVLQGPRIEVGGELDMSTVDPLIDVIARVADQRGPDLELDLGAVTFVDAYALARLEDASDDLSLLGVHLLVGGADGSPRWFLQLLDTARALRLDVQLPRLD
jgi:anti-anti-sigma regulatory factor